MPNLLKKYSTNLQETEDYQFHICQSTVLEPKDSFLNLHNFIAFVYKYVIY